MEGGIVHAGLAVAQGQNQKTVVDIVGNDIRTFIIQGVHNLIIRDTHAIKVLHVDIQDSILR